ncbi:hypothetical protein [Evansella cellulosilytica]|uniref:Uncharacterized protein n=1 Tax=Evansella cellulosilytica (strain ATCC 21833 / DSM 2522 / FERM P-1141 / JCM 9156 / N-4) TaxID=649639 RepID=E6TU36_EVAC2|nr:hypothetical protein [Evansella cellulosilytica]ADU28496.1 hypothetical protein Bcell_0208 [Evansella cellulosilytica DSM 2522]
MMTLKERFKEMKEKKQIVWNGKSGQEIVEKAIGIVGFEPIAKIAKGDDWVFESVEYYIGKNRKYQMGHLVYERQEYRCEGIDGDIEVRKQIFVCPDGSILVCFVTREENNCGSCEMIHCNLNRIISNNQELTQEEKEDILTYLAIEINQFLVSRGETIRN